MRHLTLAAALLAGTAALAPMPALAQKVLLANDFDSENGGQTALNYALPGFFMPIGGTSVDLVRSGDYGIACAGGSGSCLDLDGTTNSAGLLLSNDVWNFKAGDVFTLTYSFSGSQRSVSPSDGFFVGFDLDDRHVFDYEFITSNGRNESGTLFEAGFGQYKPNTPFDFAFTDVTLRFRPRDSGFFGIRIDGYSGDPADRDDDNNGIIFDNLRLTQAVPEPASWGMMILGFGAMGLAMRRRVRTRVAFG